MPSKEFDVVRAGTVMNFNRRYCHSSLELLESEGFDTVFSRFLERGKKRESISYRYVVSCGGENLLKERLIELFKLLSYQTIDDDHKHLLPLLDDREKFMAFIEELYNYWLKLERYAVLYNDRPARSGLKRGDLIPAIDSLTNLIIETRRRIKERVAHSASLVLRQSRSSVNAGLSLGNFNWECPKEYSFLKDIPFIERLVLMPPFIVYPKMNTRHGFFEVVDKNPLTMKSPFDLDAWFCYPIKVGDLLTFVYFPRDFMSQGVTLCNLFETAAPEEYIGKKPDMIYVYAYDDGDDKVKTLCYHDEKNDLMVGMVNRNNAIDYFGYMKKMLLTLFNLKAIHRGHLPIHGAMVSITMKNGVRKNVVIMGDSGAGKSESLEAFRTLAGDYLQKMVIIFDDMGIFKLDKGKPLAYGTEIGAFVRLDDLDQGYAFKELDRSIFMNPDKVNARVIIPVATYSEIMRGEHVDFFLYANNYDDPKNESLSFFKTPEEALPTFVNGQRMAKGTTSEKGITTSFFANPFGPVQKEKETRILIDKFFKDMFEKKVKVGQIYTRLGVPGKEQEGPKEAAKRLFDMIMEEPDAGRTVVG